MEWLKRLWDRLNGNKTIISSTLVAIIQSLINYGLLQETDFIRWLLYILGAVAVGSLGHHLTKKPFSENYGK